MYTQCPECLTVYEIDEDALQASLGIVRCGRCDKRFDALRTLSDTLPIEPPGPLPEQEPGERAPTLTEAVPPSTIERAAKKSRSKKPAAASTPAEEATQQSTPAAGASADDWFADIESELTASANAPEVPAQDTDDDTWMVELPEEIRGSAADEDAGDAPVEDVGETSGPAPSVTGEEILQELEPEPLDFDGTFDSPSDDADAEFNASFPGFDEVAGGAADDGAGEAPPVDAPIEITPVDAEAEAMVPPIPVYVRPRQRFSRASAMWVLGCVLLALLLAAQLAWANRVELFRDPATQPWMARVCRNIPCDLPLIRDTAKLELLSRDVRPDPKVAGALTITATVRNDAAFSQPWPVVVVELTDLDNNPVAMRRFRPAEYMPDPARRAAGIAPGANAVVAFEVADPGKRAVAFQFGFE